MEKNLPDGWEWKRLGDVATVGAGNSAPQGEQYFTDGIYPFVRTKDAGREKATICLVNTTDKVNNFAVKECRLKLLPAKTLIVPKSGASTFLNHRALLGKPSYVSSHLATVIAGNDLLPEYLYFWSLTIDVKQLTHDVNYPSLRLSELESAKIPLPPLETQRKIVTILEKAEEMKKLRAQADELTNQLLQSVFLEMFGNPVKNPKEWETMKLGKIGAVNSGLTLNGQRRGNKCNLFPYLRVANVFRNKLNLEEIKYIHISDSEFERFMLKKNDVLIVEGHGNIEEIGRAAIWKGEIPNCAHQNHLIRVRLDDKYTHPHFLSFFLNSYGNHGYFSSKSRTTSGLNTISANKVRDAKIPLPPLALQQKFAQIVDKVEEIRKEMKKSKQETDNLFNALTYKAFAGELIT